MSMQMIEWFVKEEQEHWSQALDDVAGAIVAVDIVHVEIVAGQG